MKLGEFIENFTHNNMIRLLYKHPGGHKIILESWDDVSMDWEVNKQQGKFRHYINNEVLELCSIGGIKMYGEAINICIEELENQPMLEDLYNEQQINSICNS